VLNKQRILVMDDEPNVGMLIARVAEASGHECSATSDAGSFITELSPQTTLIFLDLMMPRVDGVEILRQLAQTGCRADIVLMSGVGKRVIESAATLGESLGLHMAGHLAKPFSNTELGEILSRHDNSALHPSCPRDKKVLFEGADLWRGVEYDEFLLHYQPQIDISSGRIVGVEGLVRWQCPGHGLVFPDDFIQTAEDLGLIDQMSLLVFHHGLFDIGLMNKDEKEPLHLSLNISASSLRDLDFPNRFVDLVQAHSVEPKNVILEIKESGLLRELSRTLDVLTRLRMKGIELSIDDFGIGYSMRHQLRNVPATEIKIDQSIIHNIRRESDLAIVKEIIELGHELGMNVMAEGVETHEQLAMLRELGCDSAQGHLFSRPISCQEFLVLAAQYRWIEEA